MCVCIYMYVYMNICIYTHTCTTHIYEDQRPKMVSLKLVKPNLDVIFALAAILFFSRNIIRINQSGIFY